MNTFDSIATLWQPMQLTAPPLVTAVLLVMLVRLVTIIEAPTGVILRQLYRLQYLSTVKSKG